MTARFLLQFLVLLLCVLKGQCGYYVYHLPGDIRYCLPVFDCEPGSQVAPCIVNFTTDICQRCPNGYVQPDQSSSSNTTAPPACYKPLGNCDSYDVKPRRSPDGTAQCRENCMCNTDRCFYGDPCQCTESSPCNAEETLNQDGKCVPCPFGTSKKEKGCGPCKHIKSSPPQSTTKHINIGRKESTVPNRKRDHASERKHYSPGILITTRRHLVEDKTGENSRGYTFAPIIQDEEIRKDTKIKGDDSQNALLMGVLITLVVLVVIGIVAVVLFCRRSKNLENLNQNVPAENGHLIGGGERGVIHNIIPEVVIKNDKQGLSPFSNVKTGKSEPESASLLPFTPSNSECGNLNASSSFLTEEIIKRVDQQEKHLKPQSNKVLNQDPIVCSNIRETGIKNDFKVVDHQSKENSYDSNWSSKTPDRNYSTQLSVPLDNDKALQYQAMQKTSSLPTAFSNEERHKEELPHNITDGRTDHTAITFNNNNIVYESNVTMDCSNSTIDIYLQRPCGIDVVSFTPGHTQVTDVCAMPVAQETEHLIVNIRTEESGTSGLGSSISESEIPLQSPVSVDAKEHGKQEYDHLVSVSEGNTESINSGLGQYNFSMVGDKQGTEPKHIDKNSSTDSGVYNSA